MAYDRVRFLIVKDYLNFKKDFRWQEQFPTQLKEDKDKRFYFNVLQGMIRHKRMLESEIQKRSHKPMASLQNVVVGILSLGIYQLFFMSKIPARASIYETVELTIPFGVANKKSLVNAILRGVQRDLEQNYTYKKQAVTIWTSHQDWMVNRWKKAYSDDVVNSICEMNNIYEGLTVCPAPSWSLSQLQQALKQEGIKFEISELSKTLFIENASDLLSSTVFKEGHCYIQDESSRVFLELTKSLWKGMVLDVCGAPGGKAIYIGNMSTVKKLIINDSSWKRLKLIRQNVDRLKLPLPPLMVSDGRQLPFSSMFDTILLDVPCSSTGTIRKNPHLKWIDSEKKLLEKVELQQELLDQASQCLKPGGMIVYATCSLEREENEQQISTFLEKHSNFTIYPFQKFAESSKQIEKLLTSEGYYKCLPDSKMMGFFAAVLLHSP